MLSFRPTISDRELQMAKSLIDNLAEESFDPTRYQDGYREALQAIVQAKLEGQEAFEAPVAEAEPRVMDLMEALKASVEAARKERAGKADAVEAEPAPKKERAARRKVS